MMDSAEREMDQNLISRLENSLQHRQMRPLSRWRRKSKRAQVYFFNEEYKINKLEKNIKIVDHAVIKKKVT